MAQREGIWIVPSGGQDEFGDDLPSGEPWYYPSAIVLPRKGRESDSGGIIIISGFEIFLKPPPQRAILATDSLIVRGEEHEVDGPAGLYPRKMLQLFTKRVGV